MKLGPRLARLSSVKDVHWTRYVLQQHLAAVDEGNVEPVANLLVGGPRERNAAHRCRSLDADRDVDAVAHEIAVALSDHIAEVDADPEIKPAVGGKVRVAALGCPLDFERAAGCRDDAAEFGRLPCS